ncbi:MFS transporter [Paenibacillus sp. CAU 1523]|uniref:MFS transporter n=2 Tax=Paenibacillus arenosi TaxID=2774142 RepID=A0ABR9B3K8_9BACL|nr:MFS transporter [Paenibacillus arenosi]
MSILGNRLRELVIPLLVLEMTNSPLAAGLVALSQQFGTILFSIPVGTWIEDKNKVIVGTITRSLISICIFILAYFIFIDKFDSLFIPLILFFLGILGLISNTACNVLIPIIAGRKNLIQAHSSLEGADAIATLIGPLLGGWLLAKTSPLTAMIICGIFALLSTIFMYVVKYNREHEVIPTAKRLDEHQQSSFFTQASQGFVYLYSIPAQIVSTITLCVLSFSTVFIVLTLLIHANTTLHLGADRIGILLSCAGIGNIIGVLLFKWIRNPNWLPFLCTLLFASGAGVLLIMSTDVFWIACLGVLLFDGALSMAFVVQSSVHQAITPDEVMSRVKSSTYVIGGICAMLATFLSGVISQYTSSTVALAFGAFVLVLPALYVLTYMKYSDHMENLHPIYIKER